MSKFEQDVFWKDGSEIKDQIVIPFRSFELNKFIKRKNEWDFIISSVLKKKKNTDTLDYT